MCGQRCAQAIEKVSPPVCVVSRLMIGPRVMGDADFTATLGGYEENVDHSGRQLLVVPFPREGQTLSRVGDAVLASQRDVGTLPVHAIAATDHGIRLCLGRPPRDEPCGFREVLIRQIRSDG